MPDNHARVVRDDHDLEAAEERRAARRRRPVADWGVDDVFDHMPRRRFSHTTEGPPRDRRAPARDAEAAPIPRGGAEDGRRTLRIGSDEDVPSEIAALTADRDLGGVDEAPAPPDAHPAVEPATRRTVKIDGRPGGAGFPQGPQRRRPPRRPSRLIGPRPDLLAAYAVALGLLLILIAILTAH